MKSMNDVMSKEKGEGKEKEIIAGKSAFSQSGFSDLVSAMVNDTSYQIPTYNKDGSPAGEVNVSEMIRSDLKKTLEKAKWPQKSEAEVLDSCEICTTGLTKAIPQIVMQQMGTGRKFDLPPQDKVVGSIYLADVPGKIKETNVRSPKDQVPLGKVITESQDSLQIRAKSPVPDHLQKKTRYDVNGNVVEK